MIFGALLNLLGLLIGWLSDKLETAPDMIPFTGSLGAIAGEYVGPFDVILPISQLVDMVILIVAAWLPGVILFQLAEWAYRHIPMIGNG